jgi:predicted nucleic acid-binding protein
MNPIPADAQLNLTEGSAQTSQPIVELTRLPKNVYSEYVMSQLNDIKNKRPQVNLERLNPEAAILEIKKRAQLQGLPKVVTKKLTPTLVRQAQANLKRLKSKPSLKQTTSEEKKENKFLSIAEQKAAAAKAKKLTIEKLGYPIRPKGKKAKKPKPKIWLQKPKPSTEEEQHSTPTTRLQLWKKKRASIKAKVK